MPYQSFFSGSNSPVIPSGANNGASYSSFFGFGTQANPTSQQLQQTRTAQKYSDPNNYNDVPTLNQGLKAGLINKDQWMQRYKQIVPVPAQPSGFSTFKSALGDATKKVFVQAPVAIVKGLPQSERTVATGIARELPGGTADIQAQQQAVDQSQKNISLVQALQKAGKINAAQATKIIKLNANDASAGAAELDKTIKAMPTRGQLSAGFAGVAADILTAGTLPEIKGAVAASRATRAANAGTRAVAFGTDAGLGTAAAGGTKKQIVENAVAGAALPIVAEGGVKAVKGVSNVTGVKAALGKDASVNALIDSQKAAKATKAATLADRLGSTTVKEANTTHIPVREPTTTKIPVEGKSTQVTGKVTTSNDAAYIKASNKLSANYEKELTQIQKVPHPVTQQVLQRQLDTKYAALQDKLDTNYGKSVIDFKGKPTAVKTEGELPKSALDRNPPPRFDSRRIAVGEGEPKMATSTATVPKTVEKAPTQATESAGQKVSGSALRTQQQAVEQGMKAEENAGGALYSTVSHKEEAAKAVKLVNEDPQKAMDIAMGRARGDNLSHEAAVYHAVKNAELEKARQTGDYSTVTQLINSERHTAVSEHAQALGAEGYNTNPHDPLAIMNDLAKTREKRLPKTASLTKETANISKAVEAATPKVSRQDWHSFIQELQCK